MGHEDDCFGTVVEGILDSRDSTDYSLIVSDLGSVKWDIEIDSAQYSLS